MDKQIKIINAQVKALTKANTVSAVFSTSDVDRHGDIVLQNWELENFKSNPVILNSHNSWDATEVVGKASIIEVKDGKLQGEIEFAVDANPKAKVIYELYSGGFLSAFSVGFIPKEWADVGVITLAELLEISCVSVPANQMALAKAKGINVDLLKKEEDKPVDNLGGEGGGHKEDEVTVEEEEKEKEETVETPEGHVPLVVTQEDLDNNPGLVEEGVQVGDTVYVPETGGIVDEAAVEDTETKLLNAVTKLREEYKGRNLSEQRKKETKTLINKIIRDLIKDKKSL